jgi:hypothetical protein
MPLNLRAQNSFRDFNVGVSYKAGDNEGKLLDARNVNTIQKRLDTRFGTSRRNAVALPGKIQSVSSFVKSDGVVYEIAKVGSELYRVNEIGAHTLLKTNLDPNAKHRGITVNDRHIIAIGNDGGGGLYSYNGNVCTILGQVKPATVPTVAAAASGTLPADTYRVAYTFYASSIGLESNYTESADVVVAANGKINVTTIQPTAANDLVDKVFIYLKNVTTNSAYQLVTENGADNGLAIGTVAFTITAPTTSSQTPPINNGTPLAGGGKYLAQFGNRTVYVGNTTYKNEVYFSEPDLPDAYNPNGDQTVLEIPEDGGITGIATGFYDDTYLSPYLVIFKRKSIHLYSELGGEGTQACINNKIGCVSHDTITVINGDIMFLSEEGWRVISRGRLVTDSKKRAVTLGGGDIDDIFRSPGYVYEVNRDVVDEAFSVFYPTLNQYMTWVAEGVNEAFSKTYVYEIDINGFKPWEFTVPATCACISKDSTMRDIVLMGTENGYILKHSIHERRRDVDQNNTDTAISSSAIFPWIPDNSDLDATYNYREAIVKSVSAGTVAFKTFLNYSMANIETNSLVFVGGEDGFTLDDSLLDDGVFGDERGIKVSRCDISRVGESIAFGFYQKVLDGNLGLVAMQVDLNKNGNRNIAEDDSDDEVFGSEQDQFQFTLTPGELQLQIAALSTRIQELENMLSLGDQNTDGSWRFRNSAGTLKTEKRIAGVWELESDKDL